jgi:N,N'-diacetyllegionaminate synthase
MKIANVDTDNEVLIIAEIGNNHEGDFSLAERLVDEAAEAGAHAVKFQTFQTEHFISPQDKDRYARMEQFKLSFDQFESLSVRARNAGLIFISTPFDLHSARFLAGIVDGIKVASGDNTFIPLLQEVALAKKPVIVSTGLADTSQIETVVRTIEDTWADQHAIQDLAILHCVASYPVPPNESNLDAIRILASEFPSTTTGYSDHTIGPDAAVLSVAVGARIVEKHFTIDNNFSDFRDHQLSADPATLKELVTRIKAAEAMLGSGAIGMEDCEAPAAEAMRRSIAAGRALKINHELSIDDITWIRPGSGIAPGEEGKVLGRKLNRSLGQGDLISPEDLV